MAAGYSDGFPLIRRGFDELRTGEAPLAGLERFLIFFAQELWDEQGAYDLLRRAERIDRDTGALETLRLGLVSLGHHEILRGRFGAANERAAEVIELSGAIGGNPDAWRLSFVELHAWQGEEATTHANWPSSCSARSWNPSDPVLSSPADGWRSSFSTSRWATTGRRSRLPGRFSKTTRPARGNQILPDMVESAVRCGELETAMLAHERLTERAQIASTPLALGLLARSNALLAADADAEDLYRATLAQLEQTAVVVEIARTQLLFGEWLRRQRRQIDAREQLRGALERFEAMGARAFENHASRTGGGRRTSTQT